MYAIGGGGFECWPFVEVLTSRHVGTHRLIFNLMKN